MSKYSERRNKFMKYHHFSKYEFEKKCPCSFQLQGYAESLFPYSAHVSFSSGRQVDDKTYRAIFDVLLKPGHTCELEVACKMNPDHSYSFTTIKKTDNP